MNDILGGSQVLGLLSPELQAQAEQRARSAGLTNLGFALLQASQGQPGQRRPGLGQIIGQAGPVGLQAYQQSFDRTLQDMLRAQQIQDLQKAEGAAGTARACPPAVCTAVCAYNCTDSIIWCGPCWAYCGEGGNDRADTCFR
jgi:hypothetical protein